MASRSATAFCSASPRIASLAATRSRFFASASCARTIHHGHLPGQREGQDRGKSDHPHRPRTRAGKIGVMDSGPDLEPLVHRRLDIQRLHKDTNNSPMNGGMHQHPPEAVPPMQATSDLPTSSNISSSSAVSVKRGASARGGQGGTPGRTETKRAAAGRKGGLRRPSRPLPLGSSALQPLVPPWTDRPVDPSFSYVAEGGCRGYAGARREISPPRHEGTVFMLLQRSTVGHTREIPGLAARPRTHRSDCSAARSRSILVTRQLG